MTALSEPDIRALADADAAVDALGGEYGPPFRAALIFLGYVGCLPGELGCVRRDDLDVKRAEVAIRFALDGQGGEKLPKNGKPRVVAVPPPALEALADVPPRLDAADGTRTAAGVPFTARSRRRRARASRTARGRRRSVAGVR